MNAAAATLFRAAKGEISVRNSVKMAVGGVITALSVVCMLLTAIVPVATYSCPILAGIMLAVVVIELGYRFAFAVFAAVSVLSMLVVPDKEAVVCYIALFGYYPIVKNFIEKHKSGIAQWVLKLTVFNIAAAAAFFVTITVLQVPKESFSIGGFYVPWAFLIAGNIVFVLYDVALSGLITMYVLRLRKYIFKRKW